MRWPWTQHIAGGDGSKDHYPFGGTKFEGFPLVYCLGLCPIMTPVLLLMEEIRKTHQLR